MLLWPTNLNARFYSDARLAGPLINKEAKSSVYRFADVRTKEMTAPGIECVYDQVKQGNASNSSQRNAAISKLAEDLQSCVDIIDGDECPEPCQQLFSGTRVRLSHKSFFPS